MKELKELSDFGLITALITKGYQYEDFFQQGSRVIFTFEWDENMQSLENDYFSDLLDVDARTYTTNLRDVKKLIYSLEKK